MKKVCISLSHTFSLSLSGSLCLGLPSCAPYFSHALFSPLPSLTHTPLTIGYNAVHFLVYNFLQQIKRKKALKRKAHAAKAVGSSQKAIKPIDVNATCFEELLVYLLQKGATINSVNPFTGTTALHTAVRGRASHLTYLYEGKRDEDAVEDSLKLIRILLKHGATPALAVADKKRGRTPIHTACQKGTFGLVKLLISAIPEDAEDEDVDILNEVEYLENERQQQLARKRLINAADNNGWTPLHIAVQKNDVATTTFLLQVPYNQISSTLLTFYV